MTELPRRHRGLRKGSKDSLEELEGVSGDLRGKETTPVDLEPFEISLPSEETEQSTEAAAERLVAAMVDLRDSDLTIAEIGELVVEKINELETPTCEATGDDAVEIVREIEKDLDEDIVVDLDTGYDENESTDQ